jgi:hypothetical protein
VVFTVKLTENIDRVKQVKDLTHDLSRIRILVGVPEEKGVRGPKQSAVKRVAKKAWKKLSGEASDITNAQLVFLHTHGVRQGEMRSEMQQTMRGGKSYHQAYALYLHSHGSPLWQIPPRPIIEPALEAHREELMAEIKKALNMHFFTQTQKQATLRQFKRVAMLGQNAARGWFTDSRNGWPPNAPSTIARKGSRRPLIDTGEMRKSIIGIVAKD